MKIKLSLGRGITIIILCGFGIFGFSLLALIFNMCKRYGLGLELTFMLIGLAIFGLGLIAAKTFGGIVND